METSPFQFYFSLEKKEVVEQIGSSLNVWVREGSQPELVPHDKGLSK